MKKLILFCFLLGVHGFSNAQEQFCGIRNHSFLAGENLTFKVYYNAGSIYIGAGQASFTTSLEVLNGKPVYHIIGTGRTFSFYDWFFKVRDKYETFLDTFNLLPVKFIRNVNEGGFKIYNNVTFHQRLGTAISTHGVFQVPHCIQDVLSSIYYARNIDFDDYHPGDKIPFSIFLDDEVYHIYIRYLGKVKVSTRYGTFNALELKPLLIQGTIFKGGEQMTVWVSDDADHLPLRISSPISVGNIIVDMVNYAHLRYPLTSMISTKKG
ncbi:MAG: DUF3108 domain-containing protein [Chitinophagaceae bacterium]